MLTRPFHKPVQVLSTAPPFAQTDSLPHPDEPYMIFCAYIRPNVTPCIRLKVRPPVSRKPKPTTLPPGWPSPYHNKCSQPECIFPNNPQTVKGVYPCRGVPGGFYCEGTYKISSSRAQDTERYLKELSMARRAAEEEQRKRTISDIRRPDPNLRRRGRDTPNYVAADDRRQPGYGPPNRASHAPHPSRQSDAGRPPQLPLRRPSHSGYRPSSSQVEAEFITDQIMMHLYPERRIQPRW